jgi:hypothetical protein
MKASICQSDKRKKTAGSFRFLLLQSITLWELACLRRGQ